MDPKNNFKFKIINLKLEAGQGLVEAILTSVVVILVVYSLVNLGIIALRSANLANERNEAIQYTNEGLEAVRVIRDDTSGWSYIEGLLTDTDLCFNDETLVTSFNLEVCGPGHERRLPPPPAVGRFTRKITFKNVYREDPGTLAACGNGCDACGRVLTSTEGALGYGNPDYADTNCSRQVTVSVTWTGLAGVAYNETSSTILTSWR